MTFDLMQRPSKVAMLRDGEGLKLAEKWRSNQDVEAMHRLIEAYLPFAISSAKRHRRYKVDLDDLLQEACLGMLKAAQRFEPSRGVEFSTYAKWLIKAQLQNFVLRNTLAVHTGTKREHKMLFFFLSHVRHQVEQEAFRDGNVLSSDEIRGLVAKRLDVTIQDVRHMDARLAGSDVSLNTPLSAESDGQELVDLLVADVSPTEELVIEQVDKLKITALIDDALSTLPERMQFIIRNRRLAEESWTLERLGQELKISKERVRQVESAAFLKLKSYLESRGVTSEVLFSK